jgi:hypothetical protein
MVNQIYKLEPGFQGFVGQIPVPTFFHNDSKNFSVSAPSA